jgi:hypothetical protein
MWFTYDELQEMAPSEPKSLNLTQESRQALSEIHQQAAVENLASQQSGDSRESGQSEIPPVGHKVRDKYPPSWSVDNQMEVVGISDQRADEYVVEKSDAAFLDDKTVSSVNPFADPDETVVEARYLDADGFPTGDTYAFPVSRIGQIQSE